MPMKASPSQAPAAPSPEAAAPAQAPAPAAQADGRGNAFAQQQAAGAPKEEERGLLDRLYHAATDWHFEGRKEKNGQAPGYDELTAAGSDWQLLPPAMSIYHDNHEGKPELKFVNPDGREAVKDGDTHEEVTDPRYEATYNYCNPMPASDVHGVGDAAKFVGKNVGHFFADVVPYWIGGNERGPN